MFMETLLFGGGFLVFILFRRLTGPTAISVRECVENPSTRVKRFAAFNRILLAAVVLLAVATHSLRDLRERQLESARALIEGGRHTQGLKLLEASERWPSNAKPGRADYLRGIASLQAGEREKAETYLLKSFGVDPTYLWVVVDLATFYSDSSHPLSVRKRLASPYMDSLRRDFDGSEEASAALNRIEAKFSSGAHSGGPGTATHRDLAASR
jgi:tetratricopeptide (TPR) repeat protein